MNTILPENEVTEFEDRVYLNPQIGLDESTSFIDNLRTSQGQQNKEIFQQTENLGTDISSNLGGLTGGEGYFTSRYQTPQTSAATANLRATAQAAALNEVLSNEQAKWQKRYNDAYRAYQKRSLNPTTNPDNTTEDTEITVDVNEDNPSSEGDVSLNTNTGPGKYIPVTNSAGLYLSEDGKQWWALGSLRQVDEFYLSGVELLNVKNGETVTRHGVTYMYLEDDQFKNGRWLRATPLDGPDAQNPYVEGE